MMRTLRRILAIARKELLVLMGTRQSRFMVLIPPVIQIFIFAWAATMEVKNVDVVVINEDSATMCEDCGKTYSTVQYAKICPHCGSSATYLLEGNGFSIKEIEGA